MATRCEDRTERRAPRPLSKQDIDRRIEQVLLEVAAELGGPVNEPASPGGNPRPRFISPANLAQAMRRFQVPN